MNPHLVAMLLDHSIFIGVGVLAAIIGVQRLGPWPRMNNNLHSCYANYIKPVVLAWPLLLILAGVNYGFGTLLSRTLADGAESEKALLQVAPAVVYERDSLLDSRTPHYLSVTQGP
jgi:hypothetical protein